MSWLLLAGAIGFEVMGTLSLRMVSTGRRGFVALVLLGYLAAFAMLSGTLALGMPLGIAYGMWTAIGIVLTALASKLLFGEPLTPLMAGGMGLIALGVLLIELGSNT